MQPNAIRSVQGKNSDMLVSSVFKSLAFDAIQLPIGDPSRCALENEHT